MFKLHQYEKHESQTIYWRQGKFDAGNNRSGAVVGVVISHVKSFESISQHWQTASVANTGSESFIANCSTTGVNVTSPQRWCNKWMSCVIVCTLCKLYRVAMNAEHWSKVGKQSTYLKHSQCNYDSYLKYHPHSPPILKTIYISYWSFRGNYKGGGRNLNGLVSTKWRSTFTPPLPDKCCGRC